jgi:LPS sulfotransferase NodH
VTPPLILLGVSRSGTTLLRVVLDRSTGLAIPDESFFVPLLARRHGKTAERDAFLDDVARLPTVRDWGLTPEDVAPFLRPGLPTGEAIAAIFEANAEKAGKPRWGDKTPMYMRHLDLLERLFPDAQYVHLIRDGRDAALSFLDMPEGTFTRTWAHPTTPARFACLWRKEITGARALGRDVGSSRYLEVRYEALVADPAATVAAICAWAELPFEQTMLEYVGEVDVSAKPHQQRLLAPPTKAVRSWREEMLPADVRAFEEIAGDLLAQLGYEVTNAAPPRAVRAQTARAAYDARLAAWNASAALLQRSPLWRRRHPRLA